ncbi:MAG: phage exclusion protein Lit family protein [Dongiaceae bacterium]
MPNADFQDVDLLLSGAVPERRTEISELWSRYSVDFRRAPDQAGFRLENAFGHVIYNDRTMLQMYLASFLAWRALRAYSGVILVLGAAGRLFDPVEVARLPNQAPADLAVDNLAIVLQQLGNAWAVGDVPWPSEIPAPTLNRHRDVEDQAAQDIALLATAYTLLHEVRHVMLAHDGGSQGGWREEMDCDAFARDMMLNGISRFARENGVSIEKVWTKRSIGIALANAILVEITPPALWRGSSHPPIADRVRANYSAWPRDPWDAVWMYMACMIIGRLRRDGRKIEAIPFESARDLCERLTDLI